MRDTSRSLLRILMLATLLPMAGSWAAAPSLAANCGDTSGPGGTDVPCACADTVTTDTTLNDTDPVTASVCDCEGLRVFARVTLDLGGHTIRGRGVCAGLDILFQNATVGGGRVTGFHTGVAAIIEGGRTRVHNLQVSENVAGINVFGDFNVIEDCLVTGNGSGILVTGDEGDRPNHNVVRRCRVEGNQFTGIDMAFNKNVIQNNLVRGNGVGIGATSGGGNTITLNRVEGNRWGLAARGERPEFFGPTTVARNVVLRNDITGVEISGTGVLVDRNRSEYNGGNGYEVSGTEHVITLNSALANAIEGIAVTATLSRFQRNTSSYNDSFGITDSASSNAYTGNRCTGNALGKSDPPGLCQ